MARRAPTCVCQNCGAISGRWQGKCEACGEWNTIVEETTGAASPGPGLGLPARNVVWFRNEHTHNVHCRGG
jgi:DNA repair protein RadA/Sms